MKFFSVYMITNVQHRWLNLFIAWFSEFADLDGFITAFHTFFFYDAMSEDVFESNV